MQLIRAIKRRAVWCILGAAGMFFWVLLFFRIDTISQPTQMIDSSAPYAAMPAAQTGAANDSIDRPARGSGAPGTAKRNGQQAASCVNVNSGDSASLVTLKGIGPVLAARIVAWRAQNGPFAQPRDLIRVKGIGPKKLEKIKKHICF